MNGKRPRTGKQPYALALADRGIMALAGLWENWRSPADEWVRSFAIVTTTPNELCAEIHNRDAGDPDARGLAGVARRGAGRRGALKALLAPYPSDDMIAWPVSLARRQRQEQRSQR